MAKIWIDFERDDLNHIDIAIEEGWLPDFSYRDKIHYRTIPENFPHDPVSFVKGNKYTWKGYKHDKSYWIVADLIDKHYTNHRQYDTLELVFENE